MENLEQTLEFYKDPNLKKATREFIGKIALKALGLPELEPSKLYEIAGLDIIPVLGVSKGETYLASKGARDYLINSGYKDENLVVVSKGPLYTLINEGELVTRTFEDTDDFGDITLLFTPEEAQLLSKISPFSNKTVDKTECSEISAYDMEERYL